MNKKTWMAIGAVVLVAAVAYVAYRWWQARGSSNEAQPPVGTNLNSVAPELVAGPTAGGTDAGPAVDVPVNITLYDTSGQNSDSDADKSPLPMQPPINPPDANAMQGVTQSTAIPFSNAQHAPAGTYSDGMDTGFSGTVEDYTNAQ
jgi:hypothetical protein